MGPPCSDAFVLPPPVRHPVLPYLTTIFGGLARRAVVLRGAVPAGARRLHVNFQCGCSLQPRPDVAVGLCLRFGARARPVCAVREAGRWRGAARLPRLTLRPGDAVLLLFRFQEDHVQVRDPSGTPPPAREDPASWLLLPSLPPGEPELPAPALLPLPPAPGPGRHSGGLRGHVDQGHRLPAHQSLRCQSNHLPRRPAAAASPDPAGPALLPPPAPRPDPWEHRDHLGYGDCGAGALQPQSAGGAPRARPGAGRLLPHGGPDVGRGPRGDPRGAGRLPLARPPLLPAAAGGGRGGRVLLGAQWGPAGALPCPRPGLAPPHPAGHHGRPAPAPRPLLSLCPPPCWQGTDAPDPHCPQLWGGTDTHVLRCSQLWGATWSQTHPAPG